MNTLDSTLRVLRQAWDLFQIVVWPNLHHRYRQVSGDTAMKTQKIHFVWICPDTNAFEWFIDLLKSVENQMAERGQTDFLEYHLYLTRGLDSDKVLKDSLLK